MPIKEINIEHSTFDAYVIFRDVMSSEGHKIFDSSSAFVAVRSPTVQPLSFLDSLNGYQHHGIITQYFRAAFPNARWRNLYALIAAIVEVSRAALSLPRDLAVVSRLVQHASGHPGTPVGLNLQFSSLAAAGNISSLTQGSNEINGGRADFMISSVFFPPLPIPFRYRG